MDEIYEKSVKHRLWKKALCVLLSVIIAFGTFIALTVGSSRLQDWLGIQSMLSAYAAEIVDTKGALSIDEESMLADNTLIELENRDGSNTVYLFSEPVTFTDDNGNLKAKDISVEKQSDKELKNKGYEYTNGQNDYRINFSEDSSKGLLVQFDDCNYSIVPQGKYSVTGKESVSEFLNEKFETFEYNSIYGVGTNLKFYPQLNGVKDEIVLNSSIGQAEFSFELKTENCYAVLNDDGTVSLISNNDKSNVQTFSAPFAYDSEYVEGDRNEHYTDCSYSLDKTAENTYTMTVAVDKDWLNSESTVYPIVIDPTTSNISNYKDAAIYSAKASNNFGSEQTCCFGRSSTSEYGYGRALNYFSWPADIKKGVKVNSAYIWERETTGRTTTTYVAPCLIKEHWVEGSVTWENRPDYYPSTTMAKRNINSKSTDKSGDPYWYKFDIAKAVKYWADGTYHNYGLLFISSEENGGAYNWRAFASKQHSTSAYRPYTVINYTNDTTAPTVTSVTGNPTSWTKNNVTLTVNGATDNSGGAGLHSTPYSFSTTKGSYSWQSGNTKAFSSNCTVYVYVRDALGNIRLASTQTISKIDKTAPTAPKVTGAPTDWTNKDITLTADSSDSASGVSSYSFSTTKGSYSWQTGKTKTVSANTTYYVYSKDNAGNISAETTVKIDKVDKVKPVISDVSVTKDTESRKTTVTVTATDALSGISGYSFDGGETYQTANSKTLDSVPNTISVAVKDKAGNIATQVSETVLPEFYEENHLVGLINPNNTDETMQYKIGSDGEWIDYFVPFALPIGKTVNVYARIKSSNIYSCQEFTSKSEDYIGAYTTSATDLTITYKNVSLDLSRFYDSNSNDWFFSIYSRIEKTDNSKILKAFMPDSSKLVFIKENDNIYRNETYGYELSVSYNEDNTKVTGYSISRDSIVYYYNSNGVLTSVADEYDNAINFVYSNGLLSKISYGTDEAREYIINTDSNGNIMSIITPLGEKLVYEYSNGNLVKVYYDKDSLIISREGNIILGKYDYKNGKMSVDNGVAIEFNNDKLSKLTNSNGSYSAYSYSTVSDEDLDEALIKNTIISSTSETTEIYYNRYINVVKEVSGDTVNEYVYDINQNLLSENVDGEETVYTYDNNKLVTSVKDGITTTYENDNIVSEISDESKTIYEYNENDDLIKITTESTVTDDNENTTSVLTYSLTNEYENGTLLLSTEYTLNNETGDTLTTVTEYNPDESVKKTKTTSVTKVMDSDDLTDVETSFYTYDNFGNTVTYQSTSVDSDDKETVSSIVYSYDELNRNIEKSSVDGETSENYIYDPLGNVIYENLNNNETRTIYDDYSRIVQEIPSEDYNPDLDGLKSDTLADTYSDSSAGSTYVYNENGNLAFETNRFGVKTVYDYFENSSDVKTESFDIYVYEYNTNGDAVSVSIAGNIYASYAYDGDLLKEVKYGNGQSVIYEYNQFGQTLVQKYKSDENADPVKQFEYSYTPDAETEDDSQLISKIDYSLNQITEYNKDSGTVTISNIVGKDTNGNYIKKLYYSYVETEEETNEDETTTPASQSQTFYDTSLNVTYTDNSQIFTKDNENIFKYNYQNNDSGNITSSSIVDISDGKEKTIYETVYEYDEKGYITKMTTTHKHGEIVSTYAYDDKGRLTEYHPDEDSVGYFTYDSKGQLIREDYKYNLASNTVVYTYDDRGNIQTVKKYPYTRGEITTSAQRVENMDFEYDSEIWLDEMAEVGEDTILYDSQGNPVELWDCTFNWTNGRQLSSITYINDDNIEEEIISYTYDENGIRTSKTYEGVTTYYTTDNGRITSEYKQAEDGTKYEEMIFMYNQNGELVGVNFEGYNFYYLKNAMGDIIGFIDELENTVSINYYDSWGNTVSGIRTIYKSEVASTSAAVKLDNINPMQYKGYYYDYELNGYYLQSRYYMQQWCRFLNADLPEYAKMQKDECAGINLFAYCCNDPVNNSDNNGYWGADIHYGRAHKRGENYDGTYEWLVKKTYKVCLLSFFAERIAAGDQSVDDNPDTTPTRKGKTDTKLAQRQAYHFNRSSSKRKDSRIIKGDNWFYNAVKQYNSSVAAYDKEIININKKYKNKNSTQYKNAVKKAKTKLRSSIGNGSMMTLGKALHCYQDVFSHGNISAGPVDSKHPGRILGHAGMVGVDNPYYNWKDKKQTSVKLYKVNGKKKLSPRYYATKNRTIYIVEKFKKCVKNSQFLKSSYNWK